MGWRNTRSREGHACNTANGPSEEGGELVWRCSVCGNVTKNKPNRKAKDDDVENWD